MFDWARGSVLKKMIEVGITGASYDPWLKGWSCAWPLALLKFPRSTKILDVGPGNNPWYAQHFADHGCETHVLEQRFKSSKGDEGFGISIASIRQHPKIHFHRGLAGQNKGPKKYFDAITCISVLEHTYDTTTAFHPHNPLPHLAVLADMIRMLKPGGLLILTYDFYLNDMPHHRGWDFLADIMFLHYCGIPLLSYRNPLRSRTYLYNYEDTLFMAPKGILSFSDNYIRSTSVGMIFRKPGPPSLVTFNPHPKLKQFLIQPTYEHPQDFPASEIGQIILIKTKTVLRDYARRIRRTL